jgi:hypothetical protein
MSELNPINIQSVGAIAFFLVASYLLGSLLIGRLKSPLTSIAAKLGLGSLFFISIMAAIHAGLNTGMVFLLGPFFAMALNNGLKPDFSDLKESGPWGISGVVLLFGAILVCEGNRATVLLGDMVYVGNSDVSFYASYGHSIYNSGFETNPENFTPEMRGAAYHFGDLWYAGLFSNYFDVLPYYAYQVVFRSFGIGVVLLLVFGWCRELGGQIIMSALAALTAMLAVYMELFSLNLPDVSLLQVFTSDYPMYGLGSHLVIAVAVLPLCKYLVEKDWLIGACGLMLVPFLNVGLIIIPFLTVIFLLLFYLGAKVLGSDGYGLEPKGLLMLMIVSLVPIAYYILDNRLDSGEGDILSLQFIYLVVHTAIRATLSQVMVVPFLFGLIYFWRTGNDEDGRLSLIQMAFFFGTILGFAAIFPQVQGNSIQILSLHFQGFVSPIGIIGLVALVNNSKVVWLRRTAVVLGMAITIQAGRVFVGSQGLRAAFDWESYLPGYAAQHTISADEWNALHDVLLAKKTTFGYFICDTAASGGTHYNEFTYLKAILPGAVFHRMNALPKDTTLSHEMQGYYYRTSLGYFAKKYDFDFDQVEEAHMEFLKPDYLLLPKGKERYCVPDKWIHDKSSAIETENFIFYVQ